MSGFYLQVQGTGASKNGPIFINKYSDITTAAITQMYTQEGIAEYQNLPSTKYSVENTLDELSNHPRMNNLQEADTIKGSLRDLVTKTGINDINLFFEDMWNSNKDRKLTDKLMSISLDQNDKSIPRQDDNGNYIFKESRLTILYIVQNYFGFTTL